MKEKKRDLVVVKIGTNLLMKRGADGSEGLDTESIEYICKQVLNLRRANVNVALVLSGAISAGMAVIGSKKRPDKDHAMVKLQSLASVGWRHVLNAVDQGLDVTIGEILLTQRELCATQDSQLERKATSDQQLRQFTLSWNAEATSVIAVTNELLASNSVVAVNENDAVASDEIKLGDNDTLSAAFAAQLKRSDLFASVRLVMLTDVDGLYKDVGDHLTLISSIAQRDIDLYANVARGSVNGNGTGGMITKLEAASLALKYGVNDVFVTNGRKENAIYKTLNGEAGTHFHA